MSEPLVKLLIEAMEKMESLVDMMEPYYRQYDGDKWAVKLIEEIKEHPLVVEYFARVESVQKKKLEAEKSAQKRARTCPVCHRVMKSPQGVLDHVRDIHKSEADDE